VPHPQEGLRHPSQRYSLLRRSAFQRRGEVRDSAARRAAARMAKSRASFNLCATAAQQLCDHERDEFVEEQDKRAHPEKARASKKNQLKSMVAASSNPSELMFAALTAVTDKKEEAAEAVRESSEANPQGTTEEQPKLVNAVTVHRQCMDKRMAVCHSGAKGAKARSLAACKAKHTAKIASCRASAKAARDSCASKDETAGFFSD